MKVNWTKWIKLSLVFYLVTLVSACEQEKTPDSTAVVSTTAKQAAPACEACDQLEKYLATVKTDLPEEHPFRLAVVEDFKPLDLELIPFQFTNPKSCENDLKTQFEPWLKQIEQQAESIAAKREACGGGCPQYNCGEYVDFVGMNSELGALLALLADRMMDTALASVDLPSLKPDDLPSFIANSKASLVSAGELVAQLAGKVDQAEEVPYKQKLLDHSLWLKDMAQTTIAISWTASVNHGGLSLAERLSTLSELLGDLAYQYEKFFRVKDGGKATVAMQSLLAKLSVSFLRSNYELLAAIEKQTFNDREAVSGFGEKEMACYEQLAVGLGVAKELHAIAADSVGECALQQSCKTNVNAPYDAITRDQISTKELINKLSTVQAMADKVTYSYTSAKCPKS
ncbi:MAG: hypothetical protein MI867_13280 [Pseudomonadales bacterium]|nr:hypothetical protein [Pseudomonadales bacterium]